MAPARYLSLADLADRAGISPRSASTYREDQLPPPDVIVGLKGKSVRGWLPETVDAWQSSRPGRGRRRAD